jgi:hypothetical protein
VEIDLVTARLILRAVQHGMPIEKALEVVEFGLDNEEDAMDGLKDLIRQSFRQGAGSPPTLEESLHG